MSCENDLTHGIGNYCPECSTCFICLEEAIDASEAKIQSLQSELAALKPQWISVEEIKKALMTAVHQIEANESGFAKANIIGAYNMLPLPPPEAE